MTKTSFQNHWLSPNHWAVTLLQRIPSFQFDVTAPDFNEAIPLTVFYSINDMFGETKNFTIASFTDLPDLFIEEVVISENILEDQTIPFTARIVNQGPGPARKYQLNFYNAGEVIEL